MSDKISEQYKGPLGDKPLIPSWMEEQNRVDEIKFLLGDGKVDITPENVLALARFILARESALRDELERVRKALEFYSYECIFPDGHSDGGKKAKEALAPKVKP